MAWDGSKAVALMDKFKNLDRAAKSQEKKSRFVGFSVKKSSRGKGIVSGVSTQDALDDYYLEVIKAKLNFLGGIEV